LRVLGTKVKNKQALLMDVGHDELSIEVN